MWIVKSKKSTSRNYWPIVFDSMLQPSRIKIVRHDFRDVGFLLSMFRKSLYNIIEFFSSFFHMNNDNFVCFKWSVCLHLHVIMHFEWPTLDSFMYVLRYSLNYSRRFLWTILFVFFLSLFFFFFFRVAKWWWMRGAFHIVQHILLYNSKQTIK